MQTRQQHIMVLMPDDHCLEASFYCSDEKLGASEKKSITQLYIQLHDCVCVEKISKSICEDPKKLERMVHNKVINTRGHLC